MGEENRPIYSPDGRWWWDGQQWQQVPSSSAPSTPAPKKNWFFRHPVWTAIITAVTLVVVLAVIGAAVGGGSSAPSARTTAVTSAAPAAATSTPAPATPKPAATATPPPQPALFMQDAGNGIKNTSEFTAPSHWVLAYSYDCSAFGYQGNFQVYLYQGSSLVDVLVNELGNGKSGQTDVYRGGSHLHLQMNSECSWSVKGTG